MVLSVFAHAAQRELYKLPVGYSPISGATLPFFITLEERLFQKHGLEVVPIFFGGSPLINAAIIAGEFPIGISSGGAIISSRLGGSDITSIGSYLQVLTIDLWVKPEIKSPAGLKGARIAITRFGASTHFAGLSTLEWAGLKRADVIFIQAGGVGESMAALFSGRVDGAMIGYPFGLRAKKEGFRLLFQPSATEYGLFPTTAIAARRGWFADPGNRRVAVSFLSAVSEGTLLAKNDAAVSKKALRKYTRVQVDAELQGTFELYGPHFSSTLKTLEKAMANALKFLDHPKAKQAVARDFFDNSLVEEVGR